MKPRKFIRSRFIEVIMALMFSNIQVTKQAFYRTSLSFAIVNLKPLVPGHVLVIPKRQVPRLSDMTLLEISDLFGSVQDVGKIVEKAYGADALTIACQDGKAAGQSVPHVHIHILPRLLKGDRFAKNDDIYPALDIAEKELPLTLAMDDGRSQESLRGIKLQVDADEGRQPRSIEEMETEARWLETWVEKVI